MYMCHQLSSRVISAYFGKRSVTTSHNVMDILVFKLYGLKAKSYSISMVGGMERDDSVIGRVLGRALETERGRHHSKNS